MEAKKPATKKVVKEKAVIEPAIEKEVIETVEEEVFEPTIQGLNPRKHYDFTFNEKVPDLALKNKTEKITGELAEIFIKQGYGILH